MRRLNRNKKKSFRFPIRPRAAQSAILPHQIESQIIFPTRKKKIQIPKKYFNRPCLGIHILCVKDSILFGWAVGEGRSRDNKSPFPNKSLEEIGGGGGGGNLFGIFGMFRRPPPPLPPLGGHFKQLIEYVAEGGGARDKRVGKKNRKRRGKEDTMFPPPPLPSLLLPLSARENKLEWIRIFFPMSIFLQFFRHFPQ